MIFVDDARIAEARWWSVFNTVNGLQAVATNTSRRYLRSATHGDLQVPRTRTVTPRSFAVSGPTLWNTLPSTLRVSTTTLGQFQSGLNTIMFRLAYGAWLGAFVTVQAVRLAPYKLSYLLTYLLTYLLIDVCTLGR